MLKGTGAWYCQSQQGGQEACLCFKQHTTLVHTRYRGVDGASLQQHPLGLFVDAPGGKLNTRHLSQCTAACSPPTEPLCALPALTTSPTWQATCKRS
jgi:hypothetical protein